MSRTWTNKSAAGTCGRLFHMTKGVNMKKTMGTMAATFILAFGLFLGLASSAGTAEYRDAAALKGLKQGKGIFEVNLDSPQKTALYLEIIKSTHQNMTKQKVKPDFIIVFVGPTVKFLTTAPESELAGKHGDALKAIAASISDLKRLGVKMEICVIANDLFKVPNDKILPELSLVGNGFISLIGYQGKGYGLVPVF